MKRKILKWTLRISTLLILFLALLVVLVLNPTLLYANKTVIGKFTVYHNQQLDENLKLRLNDADEILKSSELYDANLKFDICLNDGSIYPSLMEIFMGQAFALGFTSNKIVICGNENFKDNSVEVNNYKWNLTQLLAHEATHCLVFHKNGFWNSNPVANHAKWKWEGYPEFVSRKNADQIDLARSIVQLNLSMEKDKNEWGIYFTDSTISSREYFNYRLMVQYCIEIKKMTFEKILNDTTSEQTINSEMMSWFEKQKNNWQE